MKKIITFILALLMLSTSIFCFVGCKEKEEELIQPDILFFEQSDKYNYELIYPNTYICELTKDNNYYKEITLNYDGEYHFYWATLRFPDGLVYTPKYQGFSILSVGCRFLPAPYENNFSNSDKWKHIQSQIREKGLYEISIGTTRYNGINIKETYGNVRILVV